MKWGETFVTPPRALLLDLDNTVYPYVPCHEAGLEAAHAGAVHWHPTWESTTVFRADYDRARQRIKDQVGLSAASHCRLLYFKAMTETRLGRTSITAATALHDAYWQGYAKPMRPDPSCAALLRGLRDSGVRIAWVTNFTTARQMWKLEHLGLTEIADFLVTSEEAGADKPDSATLRVALERLAVKPSDAWLIGDSLTEDGRAAAAAGVRFVWFRRDATSEAEPPPALIVSDWTTLGEMFNVRLRACSA